MLDFLRFPREVRGMIYKYALILPDDCIRPYPVTKETQRYTHHVPKVLKAKLAIGLLCASKLVREETCQIFYGNNCWHLHWNKSNDNDADANQTMRGGIAPSVTHFIRRLHVTLGLEDITLQDVMEADAHDIRKDILMLNWSNKLRKLRKFTLTTISIDQSTCVFPSGCCELARAALTDDLLLAPYSRRMPVQIRESEVDSRLNGFIVDTAEDALRRPENLSKIFIDIWGLKRPQDFIIAHKLDFKCQYCPEASDSTGSIGCKWHEKIDAQMQRDELPSILDKLGNLDLAKVDLEDDDDLRWDKQVLDGEQYARRHWYLDI